VIPRVGEARRGLQEHFQLEEKLFLVFDRKLREPGVANRSVVGAKVSSAPEELRVGVALGTV